MVARNITRLTIPTIMLTSLGLLMACGDDEGGLGGSPDAGGVAAPDAGPTGTVFTLRIENISGSSALPTPIAPGVWALHGASDSLIEAGSAASAGIEALAEDGDPSGLAAAIDGTLLASGVFNMPAGTTAPAPIFPGEAYEATITAEDTAGMLSFAAMFVQSNDLFIATGSAGVPLFDANGDPLPMHDITAMLTLWDSGTEANQAPGQGPNQAPRQAAANTGGAEGVVRTFDNSTRALPSADKIADVVVTESAGTYVITIENVSKASGALMTPLSPVFWALHDDTWKLFDAGSADLGKGLESLAEDGSPAALVSGNTGATGIGSLGAQARTTENPGEDGPAFPGNHYRFEVTPIAAAPRLTIATMVVMSNDGFLAFPASGIELLDASGMPRSAAEVQAEMNSKLYVWDAGTEANQVPFAGSTQPVNGGPTSGPADADATVRRYADATNDLRGTSPLGGFATVEIVAGAAANTFDVTISNTSGATAYSGVVTPAAWAVHDGTVTLFTDGAAASMALERLAEDGNGAMLTSGWMANTAVASAGNVSGGPLMPGDDVTFSVTVDAAHRYFNLAAMIVPSNDTFLALGATGIELLDSAGTMRSNADIATDIAAALGAWDAGTEANQAGAAGPDQAPRQAGPNTGASEGNGLVRVAGDPIWAYPRLDQVLRVTIAPVE